MGDIKRQAWIPHVFFFSRINLIPYGLPSGWPRTAGGWCGKDGFLAELCAPSDKSSAGVGKELMC